VQRLRRLSSRRSARRDEGAFVIEGPVVITEAITAGVDLESVFIDESAFELPWAAEVLALVRTAGVEVVVLAPGVLADALETVTPWPVAAVLPLLATAVDDVLAPPRGLVVLAAGVADPGNGGTIIRSAEAFGARAVIFAEPSVDVHNPKVVRASAGSLLRIPVVTGGTAADLVDRATADGWVALGTVIDGGRPHDELDLTVPTVLVVGNEAHGLDDGLLPHLTGRLTIPMDGPTESLNVAMATTVVLAEASRQRRRNH
jgi:TrmH family RNA methyltransferase